MINEIYQTVLAIANKEQRGYITPQEFNLFANQAQNSIFEQYFYDLDVAKRIPLNNDYNSKVNLIEDKIYPFKFSQEVTAGSSLTSLSAFYKLVKVVDTGGDGKEVEEVDAFNVEKTQSGPLTRANSDRPIYFVESGNINFIPEEPVGKYKAYYIARPNRVNWTYVIVNNKPLYNGFAADHRDFSLVESEKPKIITKILQLAGVLLKDNSLLQAAAAEEAKNIQLEKQ